MVKDIFKKADLVLLAALLIVGLAASLAVARTSHDGTQVVIKVAGELYGQYSLDEDQQIRVTSGHSSEGSDAGSSPGSENIVRIEGGKVSMTSADCPNQDCVRHRPISKNGESIICLPHKVVVQIRGSGAHDASDEEGGYDTLAQ